MGGRISVGGRINSPLAPLGERGRGEGVLDPGKTRRESGLFTFALCHLIFCCGFAARRYLLVPETKCPAGDYFCRRGISKYVTDYRFLLTASF